MKIKQHLGFISMLALAFTACQQKPAETDNFLENEIKNIEAQHTLQTDLIEKSGKILNPRTIDEKGNIVYVPIDDWTSGFFPGTMWLDYDLTKNEKWKKLAEKYTEDLDSVKYLKWHHDVGFMIGCSYLTGYRLCKKPEYKDVIITAAQSLSTRFRPVAGVIQSWDADRGWQGERGWECPVIIDNMMNLELLFWAARESGDSTFYKIAVTHADTTMKNHFRPDYSSFHVVDYDTLSGKVLGRQTHQGYADSSAWARGQAWGLYGYTVCYRETKDPKYLAQAENIAGLIFSNKNMPEDLIPYWDYDAPGIPDEPRDVSAATVAASALYELSTFSADSVKYRAWADRIIDTLSANYLVQPGTMHGFLLRSSTGHKPGGTEIDVPIVYADYYFLEALLRKQRLERGKPVNG